MKENLERIEHDLYSDDANDCIYAIRACCIKRISSESIIKRLKDLKECSAFAMMNKISDCATAALDILGVEKYTGEEKNILYIIETVFYSKLAEYDNKENPKTA